MNIKPVSNSHTPQHTVETAGNSQTTALVDDVVVAQEMQKPTKDLPDVFSLQARASSVQSKKAEKKLTDYEKAERKMLISIVKKAVDNYLSDPMLQGNKALRQAYAAQVPSLIRGILIDVGTYGALMLCNEIMENNYKIPSK
jgi:predicted transcriptional regulator